MNFKITKLATLAFVLLNFNLLYSATARWTWTGAQNTSTWSTKGNWSTTDPDSFIGSADTVVIDSNATIYPQLTSDVTVNTFIMKGGWIFINAQTFTVIDDMYMYAGNFSAYQSGVIADNLYLYGGGIGMSSGFSISNDVVIDGGYFLLFSSGVEIDDDLFFYSGTLDLNDLDFKINDEFTYEGGDIINAGIMTIENMIVDFQGIETLENHFNVLGSIQFINGIIRTDTSALVILDSNATVTGAGSSSYISGPVRKFVAGGTNAAFEFPIGNDSVYAPLAISDFAQARSQDFFTAQYFMGSAPYNHSSLDLSLNHISAAEYWILDRGATAGTPNTDVKVTLTFNETTRSGQVDVASELRVAKWDGTTWRNLGRASGTGNNTSGSLKSDSLVTSFSPFTIGSSTSGNPLPVSLLDFRAQALDKEIKVSWSTASELNNDFFTVQKSLDGQTWLAIGEVKANDNSDPLNNYSFFDRAPVTGIQFYRLMQTDITGETTFSHIVSVSFGSLQPGAVTLFPNPAIEKVSVSISGPAENVNIVVFNSMGMKVLELNDRSGNTLSLDMTEFEKGIYTIEVHHYNGVSTSKILKN